MRIHFSKLINDEPNYFVAKIWKSLIYKNKISGKELGLYYDKLSGDDKTLINKVRPKLHTIRTDRLDLWIEGIDIEPITDFDDLSQRQFTPTLKCLSIQQITITSNLLLTKEVRVADRLLSSQDVEMLAINDGFENAEDFYRYFNSDFHGKLIHWTSLKY